MSTIVRYRKANGTIALYESTSRYDPVSKQSRPIRKYLGIEDPETGELIPSTGKPGRPRKRLEGEEMKMGEDGEYKRLYEGLKHEIDRKDGVIRELREKIATMEAKQRKQKQTIDSVKKLLDTLD